MPTTPLAQLRWVAFFEGVSFLLLLFVGLPLKYALGQPLAVRVLGPVHGVLFVMFVVALMRAATFHEWKLSRSALAFLASLVPFGTFVLDRSLRREIAATGSIEVASPS